MRFNTQKRERFSVARLHRLGQELTAYLAQVFFDDREIRVWTTLDAQRNLLWHVHNYRTDRSGIFNSEVEAIEWLEESYKSLPDLNKKFWFFPGSSTLKVLDDRS
jgi:hypothetical protein